MSEKDPWQLNPTAAAYVAFCAVHGRYADSSRWLVAALLDAHGRASTGVDVDAGGAPPLMVLDWAAGTGETSRAWLKALAAERQQAEIIALEPSGTMAASLVRLAAKTTALRVVPSLKDAHRALEAGAPGATSRHFAMVSGNAMWWLLLDPLAALRELADWVGPDGLIGWSTPAMYCGAPPDASEIALSVALDEARRAAALKVSPTGPNRGLLDPAAVMANAGWSVVIDEVHHRTCTPAEWLAHTLLPPVCPPWLGDAEAGVRHSVIADVRQRISHLPSHQQAWRITIASPAGPNPTIASAGAP